MKTLQKNIKPERPALVQGNFYEAIENKIGPGMNTRVQKLRKLSFEAEPSLSIERALIQTKFYKNNYGKHAIPVLRALNFLELCQQKTIYLGEGELIVGERGPKPKAIPTAGMEFPESFLIKLSYLPPPATDPPLYLSTFTSKIVLV